MCTTYIQVNSWVVAQLTMTKRRCRLSFALSRDGAEAVILPFCRTCDTLPVMSLRHREQWLANHASRGYTGPQVPKHGSRLARVYCKISIYFVFPDISASALIDLAYSPCGYLSVETVCSSKKSFRTISSSSCFWKG